MPSDKGPNFMQIIIISGEPVGLCFGLRLEKESKSVTLADMAR